jgi:2-phosphoglycolate phosphatase
MGSIQAVLFDLDGTLLDTAPDLVYALNQLRQAYNLPPVPLSAVRSLVGYGSKALLKFAFGRGENDPSFHSLRENFLYLYQQHLADTTAFFPNVEKVLAHLNKENIPWGIVTNKLTPHTYALLKAMHVQPPLACVVCGDTLATAKPHPEPLLHACQLLGQQPENCIYIGDAVSDVIASKAAGTKSLVALYGYISANDNPYAWQADGYIQEPIEIIDWLAKYL